MSAGFGTEEGKPADAPGQAVSLYDAACQSLYELVAVPGLALLENIGLCDTQQIYKKYRYAFGGPVVLRIDHSEIAIGKDIATQIKVKAVY